MSDERPRAPLLYDAYDRPLVARAPEAQQPQRQIDSQQEAAPKRRDYALVLGYAGLAGTFISSWLLIESSHPLALFVAAGLICALLFQFLAATRIRNALVALVLVSTLGVFWELPPRETPTKGELIAGHFPDPNLSSCGLTPEKIADPRRMIVMAGLGVTATGTVPDAWCVVSVEHKPLLSVRRTNRGLSVSAAVVDNNGLIARIRDNQFEVNEHNSFSISRPDRTTLAVENRWGEEVFRVSYRNQRTVYVRGIFYVPGGEPLVIGDERMTYGGLYWINSCATDWHSGCAIAVSGDTGTAFGGGTL